MTLFICCLEYFDWFPLHVLAFTILPNPNPMDKRWYFGGLKYPYLQICPKRLLDIPGGTRIVENGYNTLTFQEKLGRSYRNLLNKWKSQ